MSRNPKRSKAVSETRRQVNTGVVEYRIVRAGYDAASSSKNRSSISHTVQDAVKDLTPSVLTALRKNSRYLDCNSAVYSGAAKRMTTLIVGTGIMASSASKNEAWAKSCTAAYSEWSRVCDVSCVSSMAAIQQVIAHSLIVDGEVFLLLTSDQETNAPRIQLIEAHTIEDIKCDDVGRPLYYVPKGAAPAGSDGTSPDWYPAETVVHFFRQTRPGQRRGVPLFTPAINTARDVEELINIEKAASKAAGTTVDVIKRKGGTLPQRGRMVGEKSTDATKPDQYYKDIVGPEGIVLDTDEEYQQVTSQRPSTAWQGFIDFLVSVFCLAGDMPPSAFLQIKVGGADTRRDLASAQRVVEQWQQLVSYGMHRVFEYFVENTKSLNDTRPVDWKEVVFQFPRKLTVDDGRTSVSDRADIASGAMTVDEYCGMFGANGSEHIRQLRAEMREINPALTDSQIDALLMKRLFAVDAPAVAKPALVAVQQTDSPSTTTDEQSNAAAGGEVQSTALNVAQIQSLVEIALKVATGELPRESAEAIAGAAFPLISPDVIARIFAGIQPKQQPQTQQPTA